MIVYYEKDQMIFKDDLSKIHKLPRNHCGLLMIPLTPQAVEATRVAMENSACQADVDFYASAVEKLDGAPRSFDANAVTAAESTVPGDVEDSGPVSKRTLRTK